MPSSASAEYSASASYSLSSTSLASSISAGMRRARRRSRRNTGRSSACTENSTLSPQDEGHAHVARRDVVVDQEVGADVQLAVVFFVEARRFLQVVVDDVVGDGQAELRARPRPSLRRWAPPCPPTPAATGRAGPDGRSSSWKIAAQATVLQREHVQHQRLRRAWAAASRAPWGLREGSASNRLTPADLARHPRRVTGCRSGRSPRVTLVQEGL